MILDCKRGQYILLDVPANGVLLFDPALIRFEKQFPQLAKQYRKLCVEGRIVPRDVLYYEQEGYKFILVCSRWSDFGEFKGTTGVVINSIIAGLKEASDFLDEGVTVVSGFMGRKYKAWPTISKTKDDVLPKQNWLVYVK